MNPAYVQFDSFKVELKLSRYFLLFFFLIFSLNSFASADAVIEYESVHCGYDSKHYPTVVDLCVPKMRNTIGYLRTKITGRSLNDSDIRLMRRFQVQAFNEDDLQNRIVCTTEKLLPDPSDCLNALLMFYRHQSPILLLERVDHSSTVCWTLCLTIVWLLPESCSVSFHCAKVSLIFSLGCITWVEKTSVLSL